MSKKKTTEEFISERRFKMRYLKNEKRERVSYDFSWSKRKWAMDGI